MNDFVWITQIAFCAAVGWGVGTLLVDMLSGLIFGDGEDFN